MCIRDSCISNHFQLPTKVPMGEDVLSNGRPADGIYFLTTNGEEPRSFNSYEQWTENWNVWNINSFHWFQHLHKLVISEESLGRMIQGAGQLFIFQIFWAQMVEFERIYWMDFPRGNIVACWGMNVEFCCFLSCGTPRPVTYTHLTLPTKRDV